MSARRWQVTYGYYCDHVAYEGPSTFLAGLHYARASRDHEHSTSTTQVWDLDSIDGEYDDGDLVGGDGRTDEEDEFFDACAEIGHRAGNLRRANRRARAS